MIDLAFAGVEPDGTPIYDSALNALGACAQRGMAWLILDHPQETLNIAALAALGGLCLYFAHDATKQSRKSRA